MAEDIRLRKIDETTIVDHTRLTLADECYYLYEYTSRAGYAHSPANNLISNLKKKPSLKGTFQYNYKIRAIDDVARTFGKALTPRFLDEATIVPIPPSKARGHPEYDDRMATICRKIRPERPPDVRELLVQKGSLAASHEAISGERMSVEDLIANYEIDETLTLPTPTTIGLFDDVLTVGNHFRAAKAVLSARFPGVPVYGVFVARRIFATADKTEPT